MNQDGGSLMDTELTKMNNIKISLGKKITKLTKLLLN
jgi:hypothetical protein